MREELQRVGWTDEQLLARPKSDPLKVQIASRLRAETTLSIKWISQYLAPWELGRT